MACKSFAVCSGQLTMSKELQLQLGVRSKKLQLQFAES